jgi:hypothetical protein
VTVQNDKTVIRFSSGTVEDDLGRINRMTGLAFQEQPESLLGRQEEWEAFAETLLGRAITFWDV